MSPGVFISYSNHSDDHVREVRDLAGRLRADGISVVIDHDMLPGGPDTGWTTWSLSQLESAERVLVAFTATYRRRYDLQEESGKGLGATCEAAAIRRLLVEAAGRNQKVRVVLFAQKDLDSVPLLLRDHQHFLIHESDGYPSLLGWLRGVPGPSPASTQRPEPSSWPAPLSDYVCPLAGRMREFAAFARIVSGQSKTRILLVRADSNGGKTALVNEFYGYARRAGLAASRIDLKGCLLDDVLQGVRTDLRDVLPPLTPNSSSSPSYQVLSDLQGARAPVMLAFDTYEQASPEVCRWLEGVVLPRLESSPMLLVVIGGQRVPEHEKHCWRTLTARCELSPVRDVQSWREYARRTWNAVDIDANVMQTLVLATNGIPGLLSPLLGTYVSNTSEGSE